MLYFGSALTPTPILQAITVSSFAVPGVDTLIAAKPDRIEAWDVTPTGLERRAELEVWGSVVAIEKVQVKDARTHILVLLSPPNAHLLLVAYDSIKAALVVTSSLPLTPPTPSLRQAEFFTSVISTGNVAIVSLWTGVLSCIDMEIEKDKDSKRRQSKAAEEAIDSQEGGKKLAFRDNFNINLREHNLLHLAFLPPANEVDEPMVSFLWLAGGSSLMFETRKLSLVAHYFVEVSRPVDVVRPRQKAVDINADTDFADLPCSCPAARRVLPIHTDPATGEKQALVIGDEYTVLYSVFNTTLPNLSPRRRLSSQSSATTSPRANALRRSPQAEMHGSLGKKRKSSMTSRTGDKEEADTWKARSIWRVRQGFGTVLAATVVRSGSETATVLLGDDSGRLTAIAWEYEKSEALIGSTPTVLSGTLRVKKQDYGITSPPSSLVYLDAGHIFIASACGDSLIAHLQPGQSSSPSLSPRRIGARPIPTPRKGKGRAREEEDEAGWSIVEEVADRGRIDVRERWLNLAPIKDFCTVEEDTGGVSHLVVASGASTSNSLRIVRSGVGMEETLSVDGVAGVQHLWTLATQPPRIVLSTASSSTVLELTGDIAEVELPDTISSRALLFASQMGRDTLFVSATSITVLRDLASRAHVSAQPGEEFIVAQSSGDLVAVGKRGGELVIFQFTGQAFEEVVTCKMPAEISSLSMFSDPRQPSPIVAVGTWTNEILLYTLDHLRSPDASVTSLSESFYASSLLLRPSSSTAASTSGVQLLVGLSHGSLCTYELELSSDGGGVSVKGRKVVSLGNRPLRLLPIQGAPGGGAERMIAVGLTERASIIFESKDRIDFSSISKREILAAASVGDQILLATTAGLSMVKVNSLKKLSVQTLDTQERSTTRVSYLPSDRLVVTGSVTRHLEQETGDVNQQGFIEFRDPNTLQMLDYLHLSAREVVTSVQPVTLYGSTYVAVGTAVFPTDEDFDDALLEGGGGRSMVTSKEGRLLLVKTTRQQEKLDLQVVVELKLDSPVFDCTTIHGFLAVAHGAKVSIRRLVLSASPPDLEEASNFSAAFIASHLRLSPKSKHSTEDRLILGDGMRSVFLLDVDEQDGVIYSDQRDMATHQVMSLEHVTDGGDGVIIADGYSNLLTLRLRDAIETAASFGLHEDVVRFRKGSLAPPASAPDIITPDLLFATADGRLGIIAELAPAATRTLDDLQRNMDKYYKGPGGIGWKTFRRGGTDLVKKETAGWIDGDFVAKLLDGDKVDMVLADKVVKGGNQHEHVSKPTIGAKVPAERVDVTRVLEAVGGLH